MKATIQLSDGSAEEIDYDLDLGGGHFLQFVYNGAGERIGIAHNHPAGPKGTETGRCEGAAMFKGHGQSGRQWEVISIDPLTLSPSLLCSRCGNHGFIRGGVWIEC